MENYQVLLEMAHPEESRQLCSVYPEQAAQRYACSEVAVCMSACTLQGTLWPVRVKLEQL